MVLGEDHIYNTLIDSLKLDFLEERIVLHDATRPINIDLAKFRKKKTFKCDAE